MFSDIPAGHGAGSGTDPRTDPGSSQTFFDSHTHFQFFKQHEVSGLIAKAEAAGVTKFLCVGSTLESSKAAVKIADEHPGVYAAVGIHPHDARSVTQHTMTELEQLARSSAKVKAIGETGLDLYRNLSNRDAQEHSFEAHLSLAAALGLPIIVHAREANQESLDVITRHRTETGLATPGIFHCFSGDAKFAEEVIALGFKVSFAGSITYKNAENLRQVCASLDLKDVLLETDAPYLAPHPYRGEQNDSSRIPLIAEKVAELHETTVESVAYITTTNACTVLKI